MWKTLRGLGFVYANGNGHGGQASGRRQPHRQPGGVGVPDDPCPLPASKNRPGNDTHPTNSISVYSVLPLKNASAGMVAYRVM